MEYPDDLDSACSTPYVSAPSSPGRDAPTVGFYYSAPASPTHFMLSSSSLSSHKSPSSSASAAADAGSSLDFDFPSTFPSADAPAAESMTSADELFFNGQIRPMKLSAHIHRPTSLAPLIEFSDDDDDGGRGGDGGKSFSRGRDVKLRAGSLRRRTRSMSPDRTRSLQWREEDESDSKRQNEEVSFRRTAGNPKSDNASDETTSSGSRSSSSSSRRWVFLRDFLYRSKSEGRTEGQKFWGKWEKKIPQITKAKREGKRRPAANHRNGAGKRTAAAAASGPSAHELHYTANRAHAEEMRKKTFLPYRQGLLGCLGFSSRGYGAMNGIARALNSVSSR